MKRKAVDITANISIGAAIALTVLIVSLVAMYLEGAIAVAAAVVTSALAFLAGFFSRRLADLGRKLSRSPRVFLSYSHGTREEAISLAKYLQDTGIKVWLDTEHIRPGDEIRPAIKQAIRHADFMVVLLGEPTKYLTYEIKLAKALGVRILPVVIEPSHLPKGIDDLSYVNFSQDREKALRSIAEVVR